MAPPLAALTVPPLLVNVPLAAVVLSWNSVMPPPAPKNAAPLLVKLPLAAVELLLKVVLPPNALTTAPPLLVNVPLAAVELSRNTVVPPFPPLAVPPLLVKLPLPAVEASRNTVKGLPNGEPKALPFMVKAVLTPAVALLVNLMAPKLPAPFTAITKFWVIPELLVMPVPLRVSTTVGLTVIVKALAPALKVMPFTSVSAESETPVVAEVKNVAMSAAPLGTVAGVQLPAVFQSPVAGAGSHMALPAKAGEGKSARATAKNGTRISIFVLISSLS